MSTFNLQMQYPPETEEWYETNTNGSAKCPAYWQIVNDQGEYLRYQNGHVVLNPTEGVKIPFLTGDISCLPTKKIIITATHIGTTGTLNFSFNDFDTNEVTLLSGENTYEIPIPSNTEYIQAVYSGDVAVLFYVDINYQFKTDNFKCNTEQNTVSIDLKNKAIKMINGNTHTTSIGERIVKYNDETIIVTPEQEKQLNQLVDLSSLNRFLTLVNIDINDAAGANLAGIGSGGAENIVTYYYLNHSRTQKTGLYSYITLNYELNPNANEVYI